MLEIRSGSPCSGAELAHAAWLTVCSLSPALRSRCIAAVDSLVTSLEARADPLELGLADDEPAATELKALLASILPVYNASLTLTARCWSSRSRGMVVSVSERPACASGHRCIAAWSSGPEDADAGQARFLAWPLTHALFVRGATPENAQRLVELLRERVGASDTIALVLDMGTQQRKQSVDLRGLQKASHRAVRLLSRAREKVDPLLEGLASENRAPLVPWLGLGPDQVMIVPRQGALAARVRFLAEVEPLLRQVEVVGRLDPQARDLS